MAERQLINAVENLWMGAVVAESEFPPHYMTKKLEKNNKNF
jgi:hypothetical protein